MSERTLPIKPGCKALLIPAGDAVTVVESVSLEQARTILAAPNPSYTCERIRCACNKGCGFWRVDAAVQWVSDKRSTWVDIAPDCALMRIDGYLEDAGADAREATHG